jgi:DNA-binding CsgD family transcriptional regulator
VNDLNFHREASNVFFGFLGVLRALGGSRTTHDFCRLDVELMFYYTLPVMTNPRRKPSSRNGSQQIKKYFHVLDSPLHLVYRKTPDLQENLSNNKPLALTGRRSSDTDQMELYDRWLSLSPREQEAAFLTCMGYKNQQIAFQMGVSTATVKSYLQNVFYKAGVRSKTELRLKFVNFDFKRYSPHR